MGSIGVAKIRFFLELYYIDGIIFEHWGIAWPLVVEMGGIDWTWAVEMGHCLNMCW